MVATFPDRTNDQTFNTYKHIQTSTMIELQNKQTKASVEHAGLVCGDHVLDVDERVRASMALKGLQRFFNEVPNVLSSLLAIIDAIASFHFGC